MKALVLEKQGEFVYKDVPDPKTGSGDVLIRVKAVAICGSDVHGYDGSSGRRRPPLIPGHEAAGVVEAVGEAVGGIRPGDHVVFNSSLYCGECYYCKRGSLNNCVTGRIFGVSCESYRLEGAMCELIAVPSHIVYPIPKTLSFESAALIEPVSIAIHAIGGADLQLNDFAVIFGAGTIGLLLLKLLRLTGCGEILVVDLDQGKLEMARRNGADHLHDGKGDVAGAVRERTRGLGADLAFEAVGVASTIDAALRGLRKGGTLIQVGNVSPSIPLPLQQLVMNEIRMLGRYGTSTEYETAIELLSKGRIDVSDCISAVAPLSQGQSWFDRLHAGEQSLVKVVLTP